jgi:hypothetical protein
VTKRQQVCLGDLGTFDISPAEGNGGGGIFAGELPGVPPRLFVWNESDIGSGELRDVAYASFCGPIALWVSALG